MVVAPEDHVPPLTALLSVMFDPTHTVGKPDIEPGIPSTVTAVVAVQLVAEDVKVIKDEPALTPLTVAFAEGPAVTVATGRFELTQVPPPAARSVSTIADPAQTVVVPVIAGGNALTVTTVETEHPIPAV